MSYSQTLKPDLSKPLNPESFKEWDAFIRKNAPSEEAYSVVVHIARIHYRSMRYIVALEVFYLYEDIFPNYKLQIEKEKSNLTELALVQSPAEETRSMYGNLAIRIPDTENGFVALQRFTEDLIQYHQFDSAAKVFKNYQSIYPSLRKKFSKVIEILTRKEEPVTINHFSDNINSNMDEWDPNPTPDGKYFFFSGQRSGSLGGHDVFVSTNNGGKWTDPVTLGPPINSQENETIDNISIDGNTLLLSGNFPGTFGLFDIYSATPTETGWGNLYHYPMPINSTYQDESGYLTSDGKGLIFTSDRPNPSGEQVSYSRTFHGGVNGNMDIWISLKTDDGWSEPINFGKTINTQFSERSAFLHPDGKTLYFSSDGHPGLGHMDVFKSVRLNDSSWTEWSEPENLGRLINSIEDDWGYKIGFTGDTAYFSSRSRAEIYGGLDLFTVTLPDKYQPQIVASVRGRVLNTKGKPLSAEIKWQNLSSGEILGNLKSNPRTGNYFIALPLGKNYGFFAEKKGYYPTSGNIDLRKFKKDTNLVLDIVLTSQKEIKEEHKSVSINNLFFDYDKYNLKPESYYELDRFLEFLKDMGKVELEIAGHTDIIGTNEYNMELSEKRAKSVMLYLKSKGIEENSMKISAFGATKPVAPNDTEVNRAKNRRVEIFVNSK
jgi:outer membrane protein OmpA-like peptidoglycan-associated protein